jgi:hypothetical protein
VPRINVTYGLGLDRLAKCAAAFARWGAVVAANTPGGQVIPHGGPHDGGRPAASGGGGGGGGGGRGGGGLCKVGQTATKPWRTDPSWAFCDTHR